MTFAYVLLATASVALAHIHCWPALAMVLPLAICVAWNTEARALARRLVARAKVPAVS